MTLAMSNLVHRQFACHNVTLFTVVAAKKSGEMSTSLALTHQSSLEFLRMKPSPLIRILAPLCAVLMLSACGGESGAGKDATQVAARVNSDEISVHQINAALARTPNLKQADVARASGQVLERLIDQELLVQSAIDSKLDRNPRVMQAIEAARREILARSYLEQYTAQAEAPTRAEIAAFYEANPALFAERRVYNLQEINATLDAAQAGELREAVASASNLNDIVNWLRERKLPFRVGGGVRAAEQLPINALPRFAQMKDGQIGLLQSPEGMRVMFLAGSRAQPLDLEKATPFIERFLTNQKKAQMAQAEMKRLRDSATVEYKGEFTAPAESAGDADATADAPSAEEAAAADSSPLSAETLERGVTGLK